MNDQLADLKKKHQAAEDAFFAHAHSCASCGRTLGGYCAEGRRLRNVSLDVYAELNAAAGTTLGPHCPPSLRGRDHA